jgi:ribosome-associated toxin RatA of RatAB toxin-antitoxin module
MNAYLPLVLAGALLSSTAMTRHAAAEQPAAIDVREHEGGYAVTARFLIAASPAAVLAVLTDYEEIPRYLPSVRKSVVHEREPGRALVEQEAVSKVLLFSKRVHLLLEILEEEGALSFHDTCGRSFSEYRGRWTLVPRENRSVVAYELHARPTFQVPEALLKHLLRRDAGSMIERIQREVAVRGAR